MHSNFADNKVVDEVYQTHVLTMILTNDVTPTAYNFKAQGPRVPGKQVKVRS